MSVENPRVTSNTVIASGNWITLKKIDYIDQEGHERVWETANRVNDCGAVAILGHLNKTDRFILIRQFRPPLNCHVIECPAGLIDEGEGVEQTALRELYEETGYVGTVKKVYPPLSSSAGLTSETICLVHIEIDEEKTENINPIPNLEPGEHIETILVSAGNLHSYLMERISCGDSVDAKVLSFAFGIQFSTFS